MSTVKLLTAALLGTMSSASYAGTFTTIYTFSGGTNPSTPHGPLLYQDGALYGTSSGGGTHGSLFKVDTKTQILTVLYDFKGGADGALPDYLIYHNGKFYGATYYGGNDACGGTGCGTVFAFDPVSESETVLYRFPDPNTGSTALPGGLIYHAGVLYGTAYNGGSHGYGSVFAIDLRTGIETDLYSFINGADGIWPAPTLLYKNGLLYGVTTEGGMPCANEICGTVFSVNPGTGAESTLHTFAPGAGGYQPDSNLIDHKGSIYGSTFYGGDLSCGKGGCGTTFSIDPGTGAYNVVQTMATNHEHVRGFAARGNDLYESVIAPPGGRTNHINQGQLAELDLKSGKRTVLYKFDHGIDGADGAEPFAPLVYANGVFYGSTEFGGQANSNCGRNGCGTLFQYVP